MRRAFLGGPRSPFDDGEHVSNTELILQVHGGPLCDEIPLSHDGYLVTQQVCLLHTVRRQNDGMSGLVPLDNLPGEPAPQSLL